MSAVSADIFHHIERNRPIQIKRRDVKDIFGSLGRHIIQKHLGTFAVRVHEGQTLAVFDILNRHIF